MINAGGEPELCCGMARCCMLSEKVGSMHAHACMPYMCASLVQNGVCTCCLYVESVKKALCKVTDEKTAQARSGLPQLILSSNRFVHVLSVYVFCVHYLHVLWFKGH